MKRFISLVILAAFLGLGLNINANPQWWIDQGFFLNVPFANSIDVTSGTNTETGTLPFSAVDSSFSNLVSGKFTLPSGGTASQVVLGDGTLGTLPAQSLSSANLQTGFTANTVYTNDTGGTVELQGFSSYTFALISGSAYLTTQIASNSAAAFTTTTSIGSATLLTGLTPGRSDSFQLKIPRNWVGKVVTTVSGAGNSIAVNGTVLKIVTP